MAKKSDTQLLKIQAMLYVILENQAYLMGAVEKSDNQIQSGNEFKNNFQNRLNGKLKELKRKSKPKSEVKLQA